MATTNVSIRMDMELKKQAETLFDQMGMNMTTAFTIFTKAVVRQGKIPFEISVDLTGNAENKTNSMKAAANLETEKPYAVEENMKLPLLSKSDIDKLLVGSVTEALIGSVPHSSISLDDYRAERLAKYECTD